MVRHRAGTPVELAGATLGPRAVRVSVVGVDLGDLTPIVAEPGIVEDGRDVRPVVDGSPVDASLEMVDQVRATLRQGAAREGGDEPRHRLLLVTPDRVQSGGRPDVDRREVIIDGWRVEVEVESAARAALQDRARRGRDRTGQSGPTQVHAIIPGVVVSVSIAPGDAVTAGQQMLVVEAMKMQNELRAPRDGTIERVAVGAGATIDVGDLLLVLA
jgi:biotin carboxyl carrier protein